MFGNLYLVRYHKSVGHQYPVTTERGTLTPGDEEGGVVTYDILVCTETNYTVRNTLRKRLFMKSELVD